MLKLFKALLKELFEARQMNSPSAYMIWVLTSKTGFDLWSEKKAPEKKSTWILLLFKKTWKTVL